MKLKTHYCKDPVCVDLHFSNRPVYRAHWCKECLDPIEKDMTRFGVTKIVYNEGIPIERTNGNRLIVYIDGQRQELYFTTATLPIVRELLDILKQENKPKDDILTVKT